MLKNAQKTEQDRYNQKVTFGETIKKTQFKVTCCIHGIRQ